MKKTVPPEQSNSSNPMDIWNELNADLSSNLHSIAQSTPDATLQRSFIKDQIETEIINIQYELEDVNEKLDALYNQQESLEGKKEALQEADEIATMLLNKDSKNPELLKTQQVTGDAWQKANDALANFLDGFVQKEANLIAEQQQLEHNLKQAEELFKRAQHAPSFFSQLTNWLNTPDLNSIKIDDDTDSLSLDAIYLKEEPEQEFNNFSPNFSSKIPPGSPVGVDEIDSIELDDSSNNKSPATNNTAKEPVFERALIINKENAIQEKEEKIHHLESQQTSIKQNINKIVTGLVDTKDNLNQKKQALEQEKGVLTSAQKHIENQISTLDQKIKRKYRDKEDRGQYQPLMDLFKMFQHFIYRSFGFKIEREVLEAERNNLQEKDKELDSKISGINKELTTLNQEATDLNNEIKQIKKYEEQISKEKENKVSDQPLSDAVKKVHDLRTRYFELKTEEKTISGQINSLKEEVEDLSEIVSEYESQNRPAPEIKSIPTFKNVIQKGREEEIASQKERQDYLTDKQAARSITPSIVVK